MIALVDMHGQRFGRWTVLALSPPSGKRRMWECRCDCGVEGLVVGNALRAGLSRSCGCLGHEETRRRLTSHGMTSHPVFNIWKGMHTRCSNPNRAGFKNYGARGITVCDRWSLFEAFWEDMGPTWRPKLTVERRDNDKGYSPENCYWASRAAQSRNRRSCIFVQTTAGTLTITEAANLAGVSWFAMRNRVRMKWPTEKLLIGPTGRGGRKACASLSPEAFTKPEV